MATGVPKKGKNCKSTLNLEYEKKSLEAEIISGEFSEPELIWSNKKERSSKNRLYFGENLHILRSLLNNNNICGRVSLIYIDPPFSTSSVFHSRNLNHAYKDILSGDTYIEFLRKRLVLLREILAKDGSIYLHLDEKMIFEMKIIMDEIFGKSNYKNLIVRKKCNPKNYTRKKFGNVADYILFYSKSSQYVWNQQYEKLTEENTKEYQYVEEGTGRRFMKVPIHAPGVRNGETGKEWRGMMPPPGKHWQYTPARLDEFDAKGEIFWSSNGNPRRKVYLDKHPGINVQDIWTDFKDAHNQNIKITGYPTEKNPELLKRIIQASSNPNDLVLDCFSGSGTTLSIANKLGRSWIGIDNSIEAITTSLRRFENGTNRMGDFVGKKNGNQKSHQTKLFEDKNSEKVTDFEVYSDKNNKKSDLSKIYKILDK